MNTIPQRARGIAVIIAVLSIAATTVSFRAANRERLSLQADGTLIGGDPVSIYPWFHTNHRLPGMLPCWVFRYEELETTRRQYFSLSGRFLRASGSPWPLEWQSRWIPITTPRPDYLAAEEYQRLALEHLATNPPGHFDLSLFVPTNAIALIPISRPLPERVLNKVMVRLKREGEVTDAGDHRRIETIYVIMTKAGKIVSSKGRTSWLELRRHGLSIEDLPVAVRPYAETKASEGRLSDIARVLHSSGHGYFYTITYLDQASELRTVSYARDGRLIGTTEAN